MSRRINLIVSLSINTVILVLECVGFGYVYAQVSTAKSIEAVSTQFSLLSNFTLLVAAVSVIVNDILCLVKGYSDTKWISYLKFAATSADMTSLLLAYCYLWPVIIGVGNWAYVADPTTSLWFITVCPLLALISFAFFENDIHIRLRRSVLGTLPFLAYVCIMIPLIMNDVIDPPFYFMDVKENEWYVTLLWLVIMFLGSYAVGALTLLMRSAVRTREAKPR